MSSPNLLLFAHPRSGSSSLFHILQSHPQLNLLEEPFNENYSNWQAGNINYHDLVHDVSSLDLQLAEILAEHNGLKLLDYQLPDELLSHLLHQPNFKIIFLRRQNLLQAVVSVLIAQQTQLWKKWEMEKPFEAYYGDLRPLSIEEVQQRVTDLKTHLDHCEKLLPNQNVLKLTYESLYFALPSAQQDQIDQIWQFLGLPSIDPTIYMRYLNPTHSRINSRETYRFLPNANALNEHCGNDETGWLYA